MKYDLRKGNLFVLSCSMECFVMQMLYFCVLCAFCGSSQCLLILVEGARGDHMEAAYSRAGLMTTL